MAGAGAPSSIQVTGARELRRALKRAGDDMSDLKATHRAAADVVRDEARRRTPYLTGALRDTVRSGATKTRAYVMAGKKLVPYAGPIHFGWPSRHIDAQPFMYDALDDRRGQVLDLYGKRVDAMVRRVAADTPG